MKNTIVSNFWTACIASVVLTATAMILEGNPQQAKIIILEGALFGARIGDEIYKTYKSTNSNK